MWGSGRIVLEDYSHAEVKLDYAAGNFAALDRFGRVEEQIWTDYGANPDVILDHYTYTYDRAGNRQSKDNELHAAFDEDYAYDALDRLESTARADDFDQDWTLDALGNWSEFDNDGDVEAREHNAANEITEIDSTTMYSQHDAAGNMIRVPMLFDRDEYYGFDYFDLTYDAWNRLVSVHNVQDAVSEIEYDGLNRRIVKAAYDDGQPLGTTHYYYNGQWQCLEERLDPGNEQSWLVDCQYVWSQRYIDAMILRDRDTDANGVLDERHYTLSDANYNVTAVIDEDADVAERYVYDAYGNVTVLNPADFTVRTAGTAYAWQYLYTGRQLDAESGLMYYRNRYYHTGLGRFVSRDPVGYKGGINLYLYVSGNPLMHVDPSGLFLGWGYGNYCGWSRRGQNGPPIDAIDAACKRHDQCQATWWTCNPYHLVKCSAALCSEARDAWNFGCAQSWPWNAGARDGCRRAAWDIMLAFCLTHPPIWERP